MMEHIEEKIKLAVRQHLPGRTVHRIIDRGIWERHIVEVELDGGDVVFFKIQTTNWNMTGFEVKGVQLFQEHGFPTPRILLIDESREIWSHPYLIQEWRGGTRLSSLLENADEAEAGAIYETLGHFFRQMHNIHNERSELLIPFPGAPSPHEYMYQAEIIGGSGRQALECGRINQATYDRAVSVWDENLDYLKDHQPSLISTSPFLWTIYLKRENQNWSVTKLTPMSELMWWDPAYNLAFLQYPPFGKFDQSRWDAFLRGYGSEPERKRVLLYLVMQRLCAAMGIYKAPHRAQHDDWAKNCLDDLEVILDDFSSL
jgi:hypothetical protein